MPHVPGDATDRFELPLTGSSTAIARAGRGNLLIPQAVIAAVLVEALAGRAGVPVWLTALALTALVCLFGWAYGRFVCRLVVTPRELVLTTPLDEVVIERSRVENITVWTHRAAYSQFLGIRTKGALGRTWYHYARPGAPFDDVRRSVLAFVTGRDAALMETLLDARDQRPAARRRAAGEDIVTEAETRRTVVLATNAEEHLELRCAKWFDDRSGFFADVSVRCHGFAATRPFYVSARSFTEGVRALRRMNETLQGEVRLDEDPQSPQFLRLAMLPRGRVLVTGRLESLAGCVNALAFEFETDQTCLAPLIRSLVALE